VQGNCTFKRTKESFEEWEIQSQFNIFDENEQEKSFFTKRLYLIVILHDIYFASHNSESLKGIRFVFIKTTLVERAEVNFAL
jgi:hypothetical protein